LQVCGWEARPPHMCGESLGRQCAPSPREPPRRPSRWDRAILRSAQKPRDSRCFEERDTGSEVTLNHTPGDSAPPTHTSMAPREPSPPLPPEPLMKIPRNVTALRLRSTTDHRAFRGDVAHIHGVAAAVCRDPSTYRTSAHQGGDAA